MRPDFLDFVENMTKLLGPHRVVGGLGGSLGDRVGVLALPGCNWARHKTHVKNDSSKKG